MKNSQNVNEIVISRIFSQQTIISSMLVYKCLFFYIIASYFAHNRKQNMMKWACLSFLVFENMLRSSCPDPFSSWTYSFGRNAFLVRLRTFHHTRVCIHTYCIYTHKFLYFFSYVYKSALFQILNVTEESISNAHCRDITERKIYYIRRKWKQKKPGWRRGL